METIEISSIDDLDNLINNVGNKELKKKVVVLISPQNFIIYKDKVNLEKFYNNLVSKINAYNTPLVVITPISTNVEILQMISGPSRKILSINEEKITK